LNPEENSEMYRMPIWTESERKRVAPEKQRYIDLVIERLRSIQHTRYGSEDGLDVSKLDTFYGAMLFADPEVAWHYHDLGRLWRTAAKRGSIPNKLREWIDMVEAVELNSTPVLFSHLPDFVAHGGRPEAVEALINRRDDLLTEEERELAEFIRRVIRGEVTDESYKSLEKRLGAKVAVEYTAFAAYLIFLMRMIQASGGEEPTWSAVLERLAALKAGTFPVPSPEARLA
jgi:hypothetical protein